MCERNVTETNEVAGKIKKKNFKIRRRCDIKTFLLAFCFVFKFVFCESNDVLTLQDDLDLKDDEVASDRRRPANGQEKDILLLDALGRRKGSYQSSYSSSQEDESIMDLLGKSEYS